MRYCLDTNTCIDAMRGRFPSLAAHFEQHVPEDIQVPAMVQAELLFEARRSREPERTRQVVERFLAPYAVAPFDREAAPHYTAIRFELERRGEPIGPNDLIIAAVARARGLTLVTRNTAEFGRVPGLNVEDWTEYPPA